LKLKFDEPLSSFPFSFNSRHCISAYLRCADTWVEYVLTHFGVVELNAMLKDVAGGGLEKTHSTDIESTK